MRDIDRRKVIVNAVREKGTITIAQLKSLIPDVSEMTLRRDLELLDQENLLVKIRGGAKSLESIFSFWEDSYSNRLLENAENKKLIAQKAKKLIQPKTSIFLDSGSTAMCLASVCPDEQYVVLTTGINCALELSRLQNPSLCLVGGYVNKNSYSTNGDISVDQISKINFHTAFIGVTGYMREAGFVTSVAEDYMLKKTIVQRSKNVVILMDSSKVGKSGTYTIATLNEVDTVVSDDFLSAKEINEMKKAGICVM